MHSRTAVVALLVCAAFAAPLAAQNLLTDGDFETALGWSEWSWGTGTWQLGADSGTCTLSSAADGTSALVTTDHFLSLISSQCIPVDPTVTPVLYLGGMYKTTFTVWARFYLQQFSDAACSNHLAWSGLVFGNTSANWTRIMGPITLDPGTAAVKVWIDFNPQVAGMGGYTASVDRLYLGVEPQIFLDDFEDESGSACHWSVIVGGV